MNGRRSTAALVVLASLVLGMPALGSAAPTQPDTDSSGRAPAPLIIEGRRGELFLGADLDFACQVGPRLERTMRRFAKLARVVERSGRRFAFTIAPNKSGVLPGRLPRSLPHGACDKNGLAVQGRILRDFADPAYVPLVSALRSSAHQAYWKTDHHWSTVGGAVFAEALATHLDPRLGRRQRYDYGTEVRLGDLAKALGSDVPETLETAFPAADVRVTTAPAGPDWSGYPEFTFEHRWDSRPKQRTWPGRTLILGDSFGWYALENLRPLFRHGHFVWINHTGVDVPLAIRDSDTVVIELLQLFGPDSNLLTKAFRRSVRQALSS